jgi:hypothetical protein
MSRTNRILSIVLVIQIVVAAAVFLPRILPARAEGEPLFGALDPAGVTRLSISDSDGKVVELAKQGEAWVVPSGGDYPADSSKVSAFLSKVAAITTNSLVTRTSGSHKRLQVADDEFARRVELTLGDGSRRTLLIGSSASGGSHVRAAGSDEVYVARELFSYDAATDVVNWIDPVYFSFAQDKASRLTLENGNGTFEFEKDASGNWQMKGLKAGESFSADSFTSLLARIASLRMTQPLGKDVKPEYGLDKPSATITIVAKDDAGNDKTHTLRIGAKDTSGEDAAQTGSYAVLSSESLYAVRVSDFYVEEFVTRARQDFLNLPPTPTPAPEATSTPEPTPAATP